MKRYKKNIKKDIFKRKWFIKNEIRRIILKSLLQDFQISDDIRGLILYKLARFKAYSSISRQNDNLCLKTGRYKGILKNTNFSRHYIKKLGKNGLLQNFKIASW